MAVEIPVHSVCTGVESGGFRIGKQLAEHHQCQAASILCHTTGLVIESMVIQIYVHRSRITLIQVSVIKCQRTVHRQVQVAAYLVIHRRCYRTVRKGNAAGKGHLLTCHGRCYGIYTCLSLFHNHITGKFIFSTRRTGLIIVSQIRIIGIVCHRSIFRRRCISSVGQRYRGTRRGIQVKGQSISVAHLRAVLLGPCGILVIGQYYVVVGDILIHRIVCSAHALHELGRQLCAGTR